MKGNDRLRIRFLLVCSIIALMVLPAVVTAATYNVGKAGTGGIDFHSLEDALNATADGDTLILLSDINVTYTVGNVTPLLKTISLTTQGYKIFVNGTLQFNFTGKTLTFNDLAWFTYDSSGTPAFRNASLIDVNGVSNTITGSRPSLDARDWGNTSVNISGSGNTINAMWNTSGTALSPVVNITGSGNTLTFANTKLATTLAAGTGINLVGNSNTITFNSTNMTAGTGGLVLIGQKAMQNTLSDTDYAAPNVYLYNTSSIIRAGSFKPVYAWYFFNSTWSPSGSGAYSNTNATINVSQSIVLAGNVTIYANLSNVTFAPNDNTLFNTTPLMSSTGRSGGFLFNDTSTIVFNFTIANLVPVNISFGDNYFQGQHQNLSIGTVVFLNFNPVNSLPTQNFNLTNTTNWSRISDFTAVQNLTFVVEDGTAAHIPRGNLSFNQNLDLTNRSIGTGLQVLGNNLNMATTGNSINLAVANAALQTTFNKSATLTVYPTAFTFNSGADIKIFATDDNAVSTLIYDSGIWLNRAGFVDTNNDVTIGSGYIKLPVLHFSKYDFYSSSGVGPGGQGDVGGAVGGLAVSALTTSIVSNLEAGKTTTLSITGNPILTQIDITPKSSLGQVMVQSQALASIPSSLPPPGGTLLGVLQVDLFWANPDEIQSAVYHFSIPESTLTANGLTTGDVVMMRAEGTTWKSLDTTYLGTKNDKADFKTTSTGFSYYAIVGKTNQTASQTAVQTAATPAGTLATKTPAQTIPTTVKPATTKTQAPVTPPAQGIPIMTIVLGIVGIIIIVVGAFFVRRWWIRRQNPALFRELK
jgi:PGF-pre-PGF domain-containing protein